MRLMLRDRSGKDPKGTFIRRKTVQINFQRSGNDVNAIHWVDKPTWIYMP